MYISESRRLTAGAVFLTAATLLVGCDSAVERSTMMGPELAPSLEQAAMERVGTTKGEGGFELQSTSIQSVSGSATFVDMTTLSVDDLAATLVGEGVTVSNPVYTGASLSGGTFEFTGDHDALGISSGIILSSGYISDVEGPNTSSQISRAMMTPGDADLTALSGFITYDAAILEFDFEVAEGADRVYFEYLFGSEEYNEFVGSQFNDVFAFFVNGQNCATVGGSPVSINTINNGRPLVLPTNPEYYVNNDPRHQDNTKTTVPWDELLHSEMDGFTVVLVCEAKVEAGVTNTMKLAIADASDRVLDSWVFIKAGSLSIIPPVVKPPTPGDATEACTPGFWSGNGVRLGLWPEGYQPGDPVSGLFAGASGYLGAASLLDALDGFQDANTRRNSIEGASQILIRAAVAAVLNEATFGVDYPASSVQALKDDVDAALASGHRATIIGLAELLDWWNQGYQVDEHGDLVLDGEGQPVVLGSCPLPHL
jgi:hypothetical protein